MGQRTHPEQQELFGFLPFASTHAFTFMPSLLGFGFWFANASGGTERGRKRAGQVLRKSQR